MRGRWRWIALLALVPGLAYQAWFIVAGAMPGPNGPEFTLLDDAMISMTYGRTLAETGELVWYPGAPRVQGYTNLAWTLVMAALHAAGLADSGAALAVTLLGAVCLTATALLVLRIGLRLKPTGGTPWPAVVAAATVPWLYPLTYWSLRGMETGIIALLATAGVALVQAVLGRWELGRPATAPLLLLGLVAALGIAVRLDVAVLLAVPGLVLVLRAPGPAERLRTLLAVAGPAALAGAGVLAFQRLYYGDWLPNTYWLKVDGFPITDRLLRGLAAEGKVLPVLALAVWGWWAARADAAPAARGTLAAALGTVAAAAGYSVWVGGDAWEAYLFTNRYQAVTLPLAGLLLALGAGAVRTGRVRSPGPARAAAAAALAASGLGIGVVTNPVGMVWELGMIGAALMAVAGLALARGMPTAPAGPVRPALVAGVLVAVTGFLPMLAAATFGIDRGEQRDARTGAVLRAGTTPDATIAVTTAGATVYHAHRPAVDLLGKSDRRIAHGPPAVIDPAQEELEAYRTLYPGHNKWDYAYSIGELRPDVVVFLFHLKTLPELAGWGYVERCPLGERGVLPLYVLKDSPRVDPAVFTECRS